VGADVVKSMNGNYKPMTLKNVWIHLYKFEQIVWVVKNKLHLREWLVRYYGSGADYTCVSFNLF